MRIFFWSLTVVLVLGACSAPPTAKMPAAHPIVSPIDNGRAIFLTGRDSDGRPVPAMPAPMRHSCAACHTATGAGGLHLPGGAVSADLRHAALITAQKHPYTIPLLERAISMGRDNEGKQLDRAMPHWKMSKRDLHDVAAYVMTLR